MAPTLDPKASPTAEELFDSLTIGDQKQSRPSGEQSSTNRPDQPGRRPPPPGHRPSKSQEEAMRQRRLQGSNGGPPRPSGSQASPPRRPREQRRPRRNSDSSVLIDVEKPLTEEEKKAKEARRRERERRAREGKDKDKDPKKPSRRLDIIDQLDATSIYGTGLFHHDGPFDAANPHRNRKGSRRAPMHAFAKDSLNMSLGGSGPLNKRPDHATFLGNNDGDASADYATAAGRNGERKNDPALFDPRSRGSIVYGEESLGLGASTFLEGTPAARAAIQRTQAEQAQQSAAEGLGRSKSIAQRIRGIKREPREYGPSGRITNPEGAYTSRKSPDGNGPATSISYTGERNPFFSEFGKEPETISVRRNGAKSPGTPPPVPQRVSANGMERRGTGDVTSPNEDGPSKPSGGFLARVKSLKSGGRRRQNSDVVAPPPAPGTAA
ncbi:Pal1 cell morphology protein [Colletotrichum falcatum]|nr:Pal1 cell morphology protein [Colletotrichum falcatum]